MLTMATTGMVGACSRPVVRVDWDPVAPTPPGGRGRLAVAVKSRNDISKAEPFAHSNFSCPGYGWPGTAAEKVAQRLHFQTIVSVFARGRIGLRMSENH